jgi:quinoprotein glucose dehydrogenase
MPSFSETTLPLAYVDSLMAYLTNPVGGATPGRGGPGRGQAFTPPPPTPPPPPGQMRFYGQFGNVMVANNGLIAMSPPWSEIVAYDLNHGTIKWRTPLGTTPGLAAKGIRDTGSSRFVRNGPVVTAGGLLFAASGPDRMVHAFDKETGKLLWEKEVDGNPDGIPAVYEAGGRQYIAFWAFGGGRESMTFKPGPPEAQGYYVLALPKPGKK